MAFRHNRSCESTKSELDIFSLPPTQTSIEKGDWIHYKPIASLTDDAPIEFVVPGHGEEYIDGGNTMLHITAKVVQADGSDIAAAHVVGCVNNWMHSLFSQIDVFLNQKMVSQPNHLYPYRAYIENLLNYNETSKTTHLTPVLWYHDTAGKFDSFTENQGFLTRSKYVSRSKVVDMMGRLHCDVFNMDRFLINGVELRVKLSRAKSTFCLMGNAVAAGPFQVRIENATLLVRRVTLNPSLLVAHHQALKTSNAMYPISRVGIKAITLAQGTQSKSIDNLFLGQIPDRIIIGLVANASVNGNLASNPYNFQHFNLNFFSLYVDGRQVPTKPLQPVFAEGRQQYIPSYHSLFSGTGIMHNDDGNGISRLDYPSGYALTAIDLTPDLSANCKHWSLQKHGVLRLELQFSVALAETVTCIVYSESKNLIEVDAYRNIAADFTG